MSDGALHTALDRIDRQWRDAGAPLAKILAPPLEREVVRDALASAGLDAPREIADWFSWHNGPIVPQGAGYHFIDCGIAGMYYQSLETCLAQLAIQRTALPEEIWRPRWFPLLRGLRGNVLAVDLDPARETCRCGEFEPEVSPFSFTIDSLENLVVESAEAMEQGRLKWITVDGTGYWQALPDH